MTVAKTPELRVLQGNPGNAPLPKVTRSATGTPPPPTNLRGEAFAEWCRVTTFLEKMGRVESIDYAALVVYVSAWATFCDAAEAMEEHGPLVVGRDGALVKNPAAQVMRDASDTMLKFGSKFGFTPKDRQMMGMVTPEEPDESEAAKLALLS